MHQANINQTLNVPGTGTVRPCVLGKADAGGRQHRRRGGALAAARRPLSKEIERRVFSQYQNGEPIEALAKRAITARRLASCGR